MQLKEVSNAMLKFLYNRINIFLDYLCFLYLDNNYILTYILLLLFTYFELPPILSLLNISFFALCLEYASFKGYCLNPILGIANYIIVLCLYLIIINVNSLCLSCAENILVIINIASLPIIICLYFKKF